MIDLIKLKIRSLTEDELKNSFHSHTVTDDASSVSFILPDPYISSIISVEINETPLGSGQTQSYNSATNRITITADLKETDIITVYFSYYEDKSDALLIGTIRSALVYLSVFDYSDFEIEDDDETITPTPENKETDLIALIASILIKPNYSRYSLPNRTVVYPRKMDKDEKIESLIDKFKRTDGHFTVLEIDICGDDDC